MVERSQSRVLVVRRASRSFPPHHIKPTDHTWTADVYRHWITLKTLEAKGSWGACPRACNMAGVSSACEPTKPLSAESQPDMTSHPLQAQGLA